MILAFTKTGRTARYLAKYRAAVPILTVRTALPLPTLLGCVVALHELRYLIRLVYSLPFVYLMVSS